MERRLVMTPAPRGIRNKNPGNVDKGRVHWQGEVLPGSDERFITFETMAEGVRCSAKIIRSYYLDHDLHTISAMIHRWAPPNENEPDKYAAAVASACGVSPEAHYDITRPTNLAKMLKAMFHVENGSDYVSDADIAYGVFLAAHS